MVKVTRANNDPKRTYRRPAQLNLEIGTHDTTARLVAGVSNLGDALMQANAKGFPAGLLYSVAGLEGRSGNDKAMLALALESKKVQQDARKAAVEYAVKDLPTSRENTEGYCSYSWLRWLPFMDCEAAVNEVRQAIQLINTKRNCIR